MQVTVAREIERLERYMMFLASMGSTAPYQLVRDGLGCDGHFLAIGATKQTALPWSHTALPKRSLPRQRAVAAISPWLPTTNCRTISGAMPNMETFAGGYRHPLASDRRDGVDRSDQAGWRQSRGTGQRGRYQPLSEINVTPFVDVMLVW